MEILEQRNAPTDLSTLILIQGDKVFLYSTSGTVSKMLRLTIKMLCASLVLRTFAVMDQPWRSLSVFIWIPEIIRDTVYKLVGIKNAWHTHKYFTGSRLEQIGTECLVKQKSAERHQQTSNPGSLTTMPMKMKQTILCSKL
jgi:hypothetical protein